MSNDAKSRNRNENYFIILHYTIIKESSIFMARSLVGEKNLNILFVKHFARELDILHLGTGKHSAQTIFGTVNYYWTRVFECERLNDFNRLTRR